MRFRVIEGGLSTSKTLISNDAVAIAAEGQRRLKAAGYEQLAVREVATGASMPASAGYFRLQIDYVVKVLSGLDPVPDDFRSDSYWPAMPW